MAAIDYLNDFCIVNGVMTNTPNAAYEGNTFVSHIIHMEDI